MISFFQSKKFQIFFLDNQIYIDPALWYEDYPISLIGTRQSPINIKKEKCIRNHQKLELPPLQIQYPPIFNGLRIRNPKDDTYFGWRVDVPYDFGDQASMFFLLLNVNTKHLII